MKIRLDQMYEKPYNSFYYPHPEPKNQYLLSDENYLVTDIIQCMIDDLDNVFDSDITHWDETGADHPIDALFLKELLFWYLWLLNPEKTPISNFSHFNLNHREDDHLTVYIRKEIDGTIIRIKPWIEINTLEPIKTNIINDRFPKIKQDQLIDIIGYLYDILWDFEFDEKTMRPISETFRLNMQECIP